MTILAIGDIHLKPEILDAADKAIDKYSPDRIILLGDYVDDWGATSDMNAYERTMARLMQFATDHPNAIWLWGNHDISYLDDHCSNCSGHSPIAQTILPSLFNRLERNTNGFKFVHYEDGIFFSHGGICSAWTRGFSGKISDFEALADWINESSMYDMWDNISPLWYRPHTEFPPFANNGVIQIVGHTPAKRIAHWKNMYFIDTFSTYRDGRPIGTEDFLLYDTTKKEALCVNSKDLTLSPVKD